MGHAHFTLVAVKGGLLYCGRMRAFFSIRVHGRLVQSAVGALAVVAALTTGCSNGANITLQAMMDPTQAAAKNGDPSTDGWTNSFLTPTGFAMGIQSAKLTNSSDSSVSFTIFDQGTGPPLFTRLYNSPTKVTIASQSDIRSGTYDQVELQVVFYEADIQVADDMNTLHPRRLRYYFSDATDPLINQTNQAVNAGDLLLSNNDFTDLPTNGDPSAVGTTGTDLRWINQTDGSLCTPRSSCSGNANAPYQGDTSFLAGIFSGYPTVTIPISAITVDSSTDATFAAVVVANAENLFFYNNTDSNAPFNYLSSSSSDGKIDQPCAHQYPNCSDTDNPGSADFWIGPPAYLSTVTNQ